MNRITFDLKELTGWLERQDTDILKYQGSIQVPPPKQYITNESQLWLLVTVGITLHVYINIEVTLGSRHYSFLSQCTDEETEALNSLYFVYTHTVGKICLNSLQKCTHNEPYALAFTPLCGLILLNLDQFCDSLLTIKSIVEAVLCDFCDQIIRSLMLSAWPLRTLPLGEASHCGRTPATLSLLCYEEAQASPMERLCSKRKMLTVLSYCSHTP